MDTKLRIAWDDSYDAVDAIIDITENALQLSGCNNGSVAGFGFAYTVQGIENTQITLALESENRYGTNKDIATGTVVFDVNEEKKVLTVVSFDIAGMSGGDLDAAYAWFATDVRYIKSNDVDQ